MSPSMLTTTAVVLTLLVGCANLEMYGGASALNVNNVQAYDRCPAKSFSDRWRGGHTRCERCCEPAGPAHLNVACNTCPHRREECSECPKIRDARRGRRLFLTRKKACRFLRW